MRKGGDSRREEKSEQVKLYCTWKISNDENNLEQ